MKNIHCFKFFSMICIGMWLCSPISAEAAEEAPGLEFSVKAIIPDNQVDQDNTYFDLKMEPSQKQTVEVEIWNLTDRKLEVETQIHSAATNKNGVIEYGRNDILSDETLSYQMDEIVTCDSRIVVPANETVVLELDIRMPDEKYEGILAGGITFQLAGTGEIEEEDKEADLAIQNIYSYVVGIVLHEDGKEVQPELVLNDLSYDEAEDASAVNANIQNIMAAYANDLEIEARITRINTKGTLYQETKENMRMAPNSNFDFSVDLNGNKLNDGEFTLYMTARTAEKEWNWEKDFTVESGRLYSAETRVYEEETGYFWLFAAVLVIVLVSGIMVCRYKRMLKIRKNLKKLIIKDI